MKKLKLVYFLMLAVVLIVSIILLPACKEEAVEEEAVEEEVVEEEVVEEAAKEEISEGPKGSLTYLSAENLLGRWNPYMHTNLAHWKLEEQVLETLVDVGPDGSVFNRLAESWENIDPLNWEIKIKEGVYFHDGSVFNAEDVKASIEYGTDPDRITNLYFGENTVSVEIIDDYTVRLISKMPNAALMTALPALPMCSSDDIANPDLLDERMNGTGAYKWVSYSEAEGAYVTANEDYWGGVPAIKDFYFKYVGDETTRLNALLAGEVGMIDRVGPEQVEVIESSPGVATEKVVTVENHWIHFRCGIEPFKDNPTLRRAIAYAIDTETIIHDILKDSAVETHAHMAPGAAFYMDAPNSIYYDPEKAKELLAEAGYPEGEGLPELEFVTSVGFYPKTKEYGEFIVSNLEDVGLNVKISVMEVAAWNQCVYIVDCGHFTDTGWFIPPADPNSIFNALFHTTGSLNQIADPEIDEMVEEQSTIFDPTEREKYWQEVIIPKMMEKVPSFPIYSAYMITGYSENLEGLETMPSGMFWIKDCTFE